MGDGYIDHTDNSYANPGTGDAAVLQKVASRPGPDGGMEAVRLNGVPDGAHPVPPAPPTVLLRDIFGNDQGKDLRAKLRVPIKYLTAVTKGGHNDALIRLGGIVFPYTPQIQIEHKAEYQSITPTHSNFPINFYNKSSIGNISIVGKFSVQNIDDAQVFVSTIHLLRSLTKMRFGGMTGDPDSGSPPPVCRFDAYGEMIFENIPVAVSQFRIELPDNIDYFTFPGVPGVYEATSVPVISTLNITLTPMYSRGEMQDFSVVKYLNNGLVGRGYL